MVATVAFMLNKTSKYRELEKPACDASVGSFSIITYISNILTNDEDICALKQRSRSSSTAAYANWNQLRDRKGNSTSDLRSRRRCFEFMKA